MSGILSRLLVRIAIVLATLAWAGFVFTQTVGDPGRGERIAAAVLADDAARAEVVAPVGASVMRTFGLPPELRPIVDAEVDRALRDPRPGRRRSSIRSPGRGRGCSARTTHDRPSSTSHPCSISSSSSVCPTRSVSGSRSPASRCHAPSSGG
jgi:hypothetical protein